MDAANRKQRDGCIHSICTMDGKLFVKTSPEGNPVRTFTENDLDQDSFICCLSKQLISNTDTSKVISGDWNTTLNPIDRGSGQPWKATSYRNSLKNLMEELNLIDINFIDRSIPPQNLLHTSQNLKI